jgi:hypothetical protein
MVKMDNFACHFLARMANDFTGAGDYGVGVPK